MKLEKVLNRMNQPEKSKFYNMLTNIISKVGEVETDTPLEKGMDGVHFAKTFLTPEINKAYERRLIRRLRDKVALDIIADIAIRDGNCIMSKEWFAILWGKEICRIEKGVQEMSDLLSGSDKSNRIDKARLRDYTIYRSCVDAALNNDLERGDVAKISRDEIMVLDALKNALGLSNEEARSIYYCVVKLSTLRADRDGIDELISDTVGNGVAFYRKNETTLYFPEEVVSILRSIKSVELANKHTRRILKAFSDKMINRIIRNHGIKVRPRVEEKPGRSDKIEAIIKCGVDLREILRTEIFDDDQKENDKKKILNDLIENKLEIHLESFGRTVDDKIDNIIDYFKGVDKDSNIGISRDGFEKLVTELSETVSDLLGRVRSEFELQDNIELKGEVLLDYNIKPKDILYLFSDKELKEFCGQREISYRGKNIVNAIVNSYHESPNLYVENYTSIAKNDALTLKSNGVKIKDDIGLVFETATRLIFERLNLSVSDSIKEAVNNKKNKADLIIDLGDNRVFIVECKASKKEYSSFSGVTRQIGAYINQYEKKNFIVQGAILVSGEFSEDFVSDCEPFDEFNLTLLKADSFVKIYEDFKESKKKEFPVNLFRHGLLNEEIVAKALRR